MEAVAKSFLAKAAPPKIYVCRHGERIDFIDHEWWSTAARPFDPHLSPHGYEQASHLAKRLQKDTDTANIKHILCSPYVRCIETIYPFATANNITIKIENGLAEWFGDNAPTDGSHSPLSLEELHSKFPLVDVNYKSYLPFTAGAISELQMHERLYNVAKYVSSTFYEDRAYSGDVVLVTHAAGVIAAVRGILSLKSHPQTLVESWYAPNGEGRVPVFAGVSCYHKLSQPTVQSSVTEFPYLNWSHIYGETEVNLLEPARDFNWAYKPDRPRL